MAKVLALLATLAASLAVFGATPSVAAAGTPCWKKVINDYSSDGQITGHYSNRCLREAMKKTPEDLRDYSPILDEISALLGGGGGNQGGNGTGGTSASTGTTSNSTMHPAETAAEKAQKAKERQQRANKAVPSAGTKESIPDTSRSIPLPLVLLGAIGAAAALATASGPLIRRYRGRFPRLRSAP
jgi:hypothetical protein